MLSSGSHEVAVRLSAWSGGTLQSSFTTVVWRYQFSIGFLMCIYWSLGRARLFATLRTVAHQALLLGLLMMGFLKNGWWEREREQGKLYCLVETKSLSDAPSLPITLTDHNTVWKGAHTGDEHSSHWGLATHSVYSYKKYLSAITSVLLPWGVKVTAVTRKDV